MSVAFGLYTWDLILWFGDAIWNEYRFPFYPGSEVLFFSSQGLKVRPPKQTEDSSEYET